MTPYTLRPVSPADQPAVERLLTESWGAATIDARALDTRIDASALPGWIAEAGDLLDVITINTYRSGLGIGAAPLDHLDAARIRVVTTEDNTYALRFYQRNGFQPTGTPHPRGIELIKHRG